MDNASAEVGEATLRLLLATGVGPATLRRLRAHFEDDAAIVGASAQSLRTNAGLGRAAAEALRRAFDAADPIAEREAMARLAVELILDTDAAYPRHLAVLPGAPPAIWVRGDRNALAVPAIAIVGSRRASPYGRVQAARFAGAAVDSGLAVVSGGAVGIDAAAHEAALRTGGITAAVFGCGLAHEYPARHAHLFKLIRDSSGVLISDFPMSVPPRPGHFPRRNRIVSGLALGVLVVEAARRSGALITARLAAEEHGREVLALPGRIDAPSSAGTNQLIRAGGAALVSAPEEMVEHLRLFTPWGRGGSSARRDPSPDEVAILGMVEAAGGSIEVDTILDAIEPSSALSALTALELRHAIRRGGGVVTLCVD